MSAFTLYSSSRIENLTPGDRNRPARGHSPTPGFFSSSSSTSSTSAILPGGTQLSSVESGRHAFFRSLAHIGRQVAEGLAYAHARGIVHRDVNPSNLLLDTEGVVWITDFGLTKGDDEGLTQSGDILGTIRYTAPERFRGEGDVRADIYALGLTLYELLTLRSGFHSRDRLERIERIKTVDPERPRSRWRSCWERPSRTISPCARRAGSGWPFRKRSRRGRMPGGPHRRLSVLTWRRIAPGMRSWRVTSASTRRR
jgi:serine/threonine protein kinase